MVKHPEEVSMNCPGYFLSLNGTSGTNSNPHYAMGLKVGGIVAG